MCVGSNDYGVRSDLRFVFFWFSVFVVETYRLRLSCDDRKNSFDPSQTCSMVDSNRK